MARIRNENNVCLYCLGELKNGVCSVCGRADNVSAPPHHLPPRTLLHKRYLIAHAIGEGGFGITYSAWDITNGDHVAIKEYFPGGYVTRDPRNMHIIINQKEHHAASNRGLKRFIDEAKNLQALRSLVGIVEVKDFFSANSTAYIVMEFLDGISLKNYVKKKGKLDCTTALTILKPVILSLEEIHSAGMIHRDISPDNIIITRDNEVKLIDFGASKYTDAEQNQGVSIVLKQGFAPEEQYRLRGEQGPWTDIYALGVTIFFCITGQLPPESIQRMYEDDIVLPSKAGAEITKAQEAALMKAIAVFSKDRYRTVRELATDLYGKDIIPLKREDGIAVEVEEDGQMRIDVDRSALLSDAEEKKKTTEKRNSAAFAPRTRTAKKAPEKQSGEVSTRKSLNKTNAAKREPAARASAKTAEASDGQKTRKAAEKSPAKSTVAKPSTRGGKSEVRGATKKTSGTIKTEESEAFIPRTVKIERKLSASDLREKLKSLLAEPSKQSISKTEYKPRTQKSERKYGKTFADDMAKKLKTAKSKNDD